MPKIVYTAKAEVTGGRDHGHAATSDGALDVQLRIPPEMGGTGGGTNPEQLFAAGYAACFESALSIVARRQKVDVSDAVIASEVSLLPTGDGGFKLAVELHVTLPTVTDPDTARAIVEGTHRVCPYSNATRGNIDVALSANGVAV